MNRGRARRQVGNGQTRAMQAVRNLERRMTGHKTVPANNPPAYVQRPWNSWTFERLDTTTQDLQGINITVQDVIDNIRAKCAIAASGNQILIKVMSAQIWCTASSLVYPDLDAAFYELAGESTSTEQNERSTQRDKGTLNMPAKCGYVYPTSDRKDILGTARGGLIICNGIATNSGSNLTLRVQVLWQSST